MEKLLANIVENGEVRAKHQILAVFSFDLQNV